MPKHSAVSKPPSTLQPSGLAVTKVGCASVVLDWESELQPTPDRIALEQLPAATAEWDLEDQKQLAVKYPRRLEYQFTPFGESLMLKAMCTMRPPVQPLNWLKDTKDLLNFFCVALPHSSRLEVTSDTELAAVLARFFKVRGETLQAESVRVTLSRLRNSSPLWKK